MPSFKLGIFITALFLNTNISFAQTDPFFISSAGNVGIGLNNNTPAAKLEVNGDIKLGIDKRIWWDWDQRSIEVVTIKNGQGIVMRFRNTMTSGTGNNYGGFDFTDNENRSRLRIWNNKVGINNDAPEATLDVNGDIHANGSVKDKLGYMVPEGGIIMYSGSIGNFDGQGKGRAGTPVEGWALCDGQGSRPDLRGRFVVGAGTATSVSGGTTYGVGSTGGEEKHRLSENEMPSHSHAAGVGGGSGHERQNDGWGNSSGYACTTCAFTTWTKPTGGNQPHENRPPYYAVLYIIKL